MFWFPYALLAIPGLILGFYAQYKVMSTYRRYLEVPVGKGLTGAEAARHLLDHAGLHEVPIFETPGELTDHYDPMKRALFLSQENYHGQSISAVGVAAHEAGHALQHQAAYAPLQWRSMLVPATQFASFAWMGIFFIGVFIGMIPIFIKIAVGLFAVISLFQLVTLPVEFDASRRAKEKLFALGLIDQAEQGGVARVLNAAALTYVAALVSSLLMLLRLVLMARDRD